MRFLGYIVNHIDVTKTKEIDTGEDTLKSIEPEYSLAFEYPYRGSLRETLIAMKTRGKLIHTYIRLYVIKYIYIYMYEFIVMAFSLGVLHDNRGVVW